MKSKEEIQASLDQFTGSDTFHKWSIMFRRDVMTEGVRWLAENAECYWLMDLIASHQSTSSVRKEEFQTWILTKSKSSSGALAVAEDGNENRIASQRVKYTDFPLDTIKFFAVRNELGGITIMLPNEY